MNIKRQYIVDERDQRVAVQIDIETFERIEETLENFALYALMEKTDEDVEISLEEAGSLYTELEKA